jgi:hypothetical protein
MTLKKGGSIKNWAKQNQSPQTFQKKTQRRNTVTPSAPCNSKTHKIILHMISRILGQFPNFHTFYCIIQNENIKNLNRLLKIIITGLID